MTVNELYTLEGLELSYLESKEETNSYWQSCYKFISENWEKDIDYMSPKQASWVSKILEACVDEIRESMEKEAWAE